MQPGVIVSLKVFDLSQFFPAGCYHCRFWFIKFVVDLLCEFGKMSFCMQSVEVQRVEVQQILLR